MPTIDMSDCPCCDPPLCGCDPRPPNSLTATLSISAGPVTLNRTPGSEEWIGDFSYCGEMLRIAMRCEAPNNGCGAYIMDVISLGSPPGECGDSGAISAGSGCTCDPFEGEFGPFNFNSGGFCACTGDTSVTITVTE